MNEKAGDSAAGPESGAAFLLPSRPFHRRAFAAAAGALLALAGAAGAQSADPHAEKRRGMLEAIADTTTRTAGSTGVEVIAPEVMAALERVPRHEFVPPEITDLAWENRPLPIGHGQTISQPYIVALMTHLLVLAPHHRVLEIGTGSGYQAAVLAELVDHVHTIEIVPPLARQAAERLPRLGYATSRCASATGTTDGARPGRSTRSSSPPPPPTCRRRSSTSSPRTGCW